ncbi:hypothetical protein [Prolixibacter denitrificans]|jgi:hypothetical protein|uniref:Uncharacterized protein n=1 Tax=Prolixibacter denitrificans TaxID=1541063 RepID=A0A2P8CF94_9BACT|nr:hypothetical protein [Prolixibacter denitrificans]PSK83660.1 hypothetical protein CLV93_10375 [Prolixibacter denitrificans]GET23207.1 hypothetical protein JCM18694_34530 [Prolixibacter denitrificans]
MKRRLTKEDIRFLKYEKRNGYVFAGMILLAGILFNFIDLSMTDIIHQHTVLVAVDMVIIGLSWMTLHRVNRDLNRDLEAGYRTVRIEKVTGKMKHTGHEAGSGTLSNQEMKSIDKFQLIINQAAYDVSREFFDKVSEGDEVEMYFAQHSHVLLGISLAEL